MCSGVVAAELGLIEDLVSEDDLKLKSGVANDMALFTNWNVVSSAFIMICQVHQLIVISLHIMMADYLP